ncbi:hypothetical protein [Rhodospira trueperi]|uniref:hypothetical protein n=1 Tax=Rhodospira trueperi TaxID=69960 RepID=UPI00115FA3A8|nr:hypothetical protein [Rhodospira trueperi]
MAQYPIADKLYRNAAIHCATLAITQDVENEAHWPKMAQPNAALRNGTITFVKTNGRTYGITCQHVVKHYRDVVAASGNVGTYSMRTMKNGFYVVIDRFMQPSPQFGETRPDIAIREICSKHISFIGKEAMNIDTMKDIPEDIKHAYAVGFPEGMKYHKPDGQLGYRVSLPQVEILAELSRRPDSRFTMFSEIKKPACGISYSGMSGGPIFWSTNEGDYGILGIIYEGAPGKDNKTIYVYGELASPHVIREWIAQCDSWSLEHR